MKAWIQAGAATAVAVGLASFAHAADHADGPAVRENPDADITDVYAWMDPSGRVNLVMDFFPDAPSDALASDAVLYAFHLESMRELGDTNGVETLIVCGFEQDQSIQCWAGDDEYVTGDASGDDGRASESGRMRVFTDIKNDPFFFNLRGFQETTSIVKEAAASLSFDEAGCPLLDDATSTALVTQLQSGPDGAEAQDDFATQNVRVLAIQLDAALVTAGGPILSVWASTHQRQE